MAAAPACDFTPQPRATVWKSHCGLGGLGLDAWCPVMGTNVAGVAVNGDYCVVPF